MPRKTIPDKTDRKCSWSCGGEEGTDRLGPTAKRTESRSDGSEGGTTRAPPRLFETGYAQSGGSTCPPTLEAPIPIGIISVVPGVTPRLSVDQGVKPGVPSAVAPRPTDGPGIEAPSMRASFRSFGRSRRVRQAVVVSWLPPDASRLRIFAAAVPGVVPRLSEPTDSAADRLSRPTLPPADRLSR